MNNKTIRPLLTALAGAARMEGGEWVAGSSRPALSELSSGDRCDDRSAQRADPACAARSVLSISAPLRRDRAEVRDEGGECGSKARRAGIVAENGMKNDSSSVGAASSTGRTEYAAPTGLNWSLPSVLQRFRTYGAVFCFFLLPFAFCLRASGQSYSIDWSTIDGGGGTSTGGVYSVSGTIGQPDASRQVMAGGNYAIAGGYWVLPQAVQTEGAPTLTITPAGAGQVAISWIPNDTNYVLQETWSLSPAHWTNSPSGSTNPVVVPATWPTRFYRLFKP